LGEGIACIAGKGLDPRGILAARRGLDACSHIDTPGGEGADGFRNIVRIEAAGGDEPQLWRNPMEHVLRRLPVITGAGAAMAYRAARVDQQRVDCAVASGIARDSFHLRLHVIAKGQYGQNADRAGCLLGGEVCSQATR
jgi:hypothetical protein